jgi:hypothetical protein
MFVGQLSKCSAKADVALRQRACVASKHEQHSTRYIVSNLRWEETATLAQSKLVIEAIFERRYRK